MAKAIFVTGTGTDVGKTYVTGLLLKKMNEMGKKAAYYKAAMRAKHLPVRGIIFNHFHPGNVMEEDNLAMCEAMTGIPVIACVKDGDDSLAIDETVLENLFEVKEL